MLLISISISVQLWSLCKFMSFFSFCYNVKWLKENHEWWLNHNKIILSQDQITK